MNRFLQENAFLLRFAGLSMLAGLSIGIAKFTTSIFAIELNSNGIELGLIASAQSAGILIMSLPIGVLVDRVGPQKLFFIGSLLGGLLYGVMGFLSEPMLLALLTFLISFCMPFRFVSLNAVFMQQLDQVGMAKAGWFRAMHMIGFFMLGPMIAISILKVLEISGTFLFVAFLFAITAALSPSVMRFYQMPDISLQRKLNLAEWWSQFELMRQRCELRLVCIIEFVAQAVMNFFSFYIVVIAITNYQMSSAQAALLVTLQGGLFITILLLWGYIAQRLSRKHSYAIGLALIFISLLALSVNIGSAMLWLGATLLGIGLGILQVINVSRFAVIGGILGRGRIAGINAFVGPAGGIVGSFMGGVIGHWLPLQWCFLCFIPLVMYLAWQIFLAKKIAPTLADLRVVAPPES